jgi:deazaflavin-dependent oxidoreductase (nitroreductase family)
MDITKFNPSQIDGLRRAFRVLNRFMVLMWKLGMGRMINFWPAVIGRIMVIKHVGRKSGKVRFAPVNYAPIEGEIYCMSGFGAGSDWYRNIMANPSVELWLPEGKFPVTAEDVSDSPKRLFLLRQVIIASGFAAPLFGISPKISDEELSALATDYRILHFIREK